MRAWWIRRRRGAIGPVDTGPDGASGPDGAGGVTGS
jgi:hypothetical protein